MLLAFAGLSQPMGVKEALEEGAEFVKVLFQSREIRHIGST